MGESKGTGRDPAERSIAAVIDRVYAAVCARERGEREEGLRWGLPDLDELTGGLKAGELAVLAGRPSMGKTALAHDLLRHATLVGGRGAVLFSRLPSEAAVERLLCAQARVSARRTWGGFLDLEERRRFLGACDALHGARLFCVSEGFTPLASVAAASRELAAAHPIDLVVVEGVERLWGEAHEPARPTAVGRVLSALAREISVAVLALAPVTRRAAAQRGPSAQDVWGGAGLLGHADKLILLHRADSYRPDREELRGRAQVLVALNRTGCTGVCELRFVRSEVRFESIGLGPAGPATAIEPRPGGGG